MDEEKERKRAERRAYDAARKEKALKDKQERDEKEAVLIHACRRIVYDEDSTPAELAFAVGVLDEIYSLFDVPNYAKRLGRAQDDALIAEMAAEFRRRIDEAQ